MYGAVMKQHDLSTFRDLMEDIYAKYNRPELISPDPLQFLSDYNDIADREIVGIVASSLAYGRVAQILKSVAVALDKMGGRPRQYIEHTSDKDIKKDFRGFKHRFTTGEDLTTMLVGIKQSISKWGSLNKCFQSGLKAGDATILPALSKFVDAIGAKMLPDPLQGSACKRLNLYLRWMVRRDAVDPGGWKGIPASKLVIPLDTHMFAIGRGFGMTARKSADLKTAVEITEAFGCLSPQDPVKYDFALTRFGIRSDMDIKDLLAKTNQPKANKILAKRNSIR